MDNTASQRAAGTARCPLLRPALALAAGLIGITIGVGIGLPHAAKTGLTPTAIIGLVCLVAGLVSLAAGARMLLRARRWFVAAPVLLGLVLVTALMVLTVGQALYATHVPPTELGSETPADEGLEYREATAITADGVTLSAWYIPSSTGAAVVLRHGAGSTRTDTLDHAAVLARHGYGVLMMDARGHGLSGGEAMDFGWYGDADIRAGVDVLIAQSGVDPDRIGVVGLSMGGEEAIGAAAADTRIRAVVAEGAQHRTAADKQWLSQVYGLPGAVQEQLDKVTYGAADLFTPAGPPTALRQAAALAAPRPMLLIAGGAVDDEEHSARWIQAASPDSVAVWVVPGAGHVQGLSTDPQEWRRRVTEFLDAALAVGG